MFFGEELPWQHFIKLNNIRKLPLREQKEYYNRYLNDLNTQRMWAQIGAANGGESTSTPAVPQALRLLFDDIENANLLVGDASNLEDWNTFFDLPTYGTPFTSVTVVGNEVELFGGGNIILKESLFGDSIYGVNLIEFVDESGCIVELEYNVFGDDNLGYGCENLTTVSLPNCLIAAGYCFINCDSLVNLSLPLLTEAGPSCFGSCTLLTNTDWLNLNAIGYACFFGTNISSLNLPSLTVLTDGMFGGMFQLTSTDDISAPALTNPTSLPNYLFSACTQLATVNFPTLINVGEQCFFQCTSLTSISLPLCTNLGGTVGDNDVFLNITGNTITLTVPSALMTADAGNPDGDIAYLQANNTVTIVTV
jgi:hypothetical protein